MQAILSALGRLMIVTIFVMSAAGHKIPHFADVVKEMETKGVPQPGIMLVGAITFLVVGGFLVLFGFKARFGAFLLFMFLFVVTYYFHAFWKVPEAMKQAETINFMKNLSLMGTMVFIIANGAGAGSIDAVRAARRVEPAPPAAKK